ncbi:MAG: site-specific DNA-methyltransferase [Candidatus Liptonbacteria bacterium]|nr:site-specific DNA-methyltransferase [Candidatus Liptonbacteria bacterium]
MRGESVYSKRKYNVVQVSQAKKVAETWLASADLQNSVAFGLPEADDRYDIWRVPLLTLGKNHRVGEVVIDAFSTLVVEDKTTRKEVLEDRLLGRVEKVNLHRKRNDKCFISQQRNTIAHGDSEFVLQEMAAGSVDLVFTSPPYYNARPEYSDYISYEDYLLKMRKIIQATHRVLNEGRFFVMNISPVLVRRASRSEASKRIAVPFDMHKVFIEEGFDFIDDIIWVKPEGAGWATGRGRRFAADRNPLQYKTVPITEHILVYRKHTDKLIDWNIRYHPNQKAVKESKIDGSYERTDVWRIKPAHSKRHPAIFPVELAEKVIRYYSFKTDVVLDPFAGVGTVGEAAVGLGRRFVLVDNEKKYVDIIRRDAKKWLGKSASDILYINCVADSSAPGTLF